MTNQTYTPDMVTGDMDMAAHRVIEVSDGGSEWVVENMASTIAAAINASPLWAEVQQLREAKRGLVEALRPLASYTMPDNPQGNTGLYAIKHQHIITAREALAKHGGGQ